MHHEITVFSTYFYLPIYSLTLFNFNDNELATFERDVDWNWLRSISRKWILNAFCDNDNNDDDDKKKECWVAKSQWIFEVIRYLSETSVAIKHQGRVCRVVELKRPYLMDIYGRLKCAHIWLPITTL